MWMCVDVGNVFGRRCSGRILCGRGNLGEKFPAIKAGPRLDTQWFIFVARAFQAFRGLLIGGDARVYSMRQHDKCWHRVSLKSFQQK